MRDHSKVFEGQLTAQTKMGKTHVDGAERETGSSKLIKRA
jgi:hypothetical protein